MNQTKKMIGFGVLAVFIVGIVVILVMNTQSSQTTTTPSAATTQTVTDQSNNTSSAVTNSPGTTTSSVYTMAQVAQHNSQASCWTAINGNVYDLTSWINQHPGGPGHILALCGVDGSAAFNAQHGGQARPAQELASFLIGALSK